MAQPDAPITTIDNALGITPPTGVRPFAVVGCSSQGTTNQPASFSRVSDLVSAFGYGPMVEDAAFAIERFGLTVTAVRSAEGGGGAGANGSVTEDNALGVTEGTSTKTASGTPFGAYEVYWIATGAGTVGTAGITFQYSLDGGRTLSGVTALGTANSFTIPNSGVTIDFGAGTVVVGDRAQWVTTAPEPESAQVTAALNALFDTNINWEIAGMAFPLDGSLFDAIDAVFVGRFATNKRRAWVGNTRMQNAGETAADYKTALDAIFDSKATTFGMVCAGNAWMISGVEGQQFKAPWSRYQAAREASVNIEVNTANVSFVASGVSLYDDSGALIGHDETINPGLDDSRFCVARTWEGRQGVYTNLARLLSATGSDFRLLLFRRVLNAAADAIRGYMVTRLNRATRVDSDTGYIFEADAKAN